MEIPALSINLKNEILRVEPSLGVKMEIYSEKNDQDYRKYTVQPWRRHSLLLRVYHALKHWPN